MNLERSSEKIKLPKRRVLIFFPLIIIALAFKFVVPFTAYNNLSAEEAIQKKYDGYDTLYYKADEYYFIYAVDAVTNSNIIDILHSENTGENTFLIYESNTAVEFCYISFDNDYFEGEAHAYKDTEDYIILVTYYNMDNRIEINDNFKYYDSQTYEPNLNRYFLFVVPNDRFNTDYNINVTINGESKCLLNYDKINEKLR